MRLIDRRLELNSRVDASPKEGALLLCAAASVLVTAGIVGVLVFETAGFLREVPIVEFLTDTQWTPLFAQKRFGILPLVSGTLLVTAIAMAVALPAGLLSQWLPCRFACNLTC